MSTVAEWLVKNAAWIEKHSKYIAGLKNPSLQQRTLIQLLAIPEIGRAHV